MFLSHAESPGDSIPEDIMRIPGTMPFILPAISKRPEYCMVPSLAGENGGFGEITLFKKWQSWPPWQQVPVRVRNTAYNVHILAAVWDGT